MRKIIFYSIIFVFFLFTKLLADDKAIEPFNKIIKVEVTGKAHAVSASADIIYYIYINAGVLKTSNDDLNEIVNDTKKVVNKIAASKWVFYFGGLIKINVGSLCIASSYSTIEQLNTATNTSGFCLSRSIKIHVETANQALTQILVLNLIDSLNQEDLLITSNHVTGFAILAQGVSLDKLLEKARKNQLEEAKIIGASLAKCRNLKLGNIVDIADSIISKTDYAFSSELTVISHVYFKLID